MLAVIPSIGRTPLLTTLVQTLLAASARVLVVDNGVGASRPLIAAPIHPMMEWFHRPGWGIYRTWNFGLDCVEFMDDEDQVLILNDDVILKLGAAFVICKLLRESGFALLGFDNRRDILTDPPAVRELPATTRNGHSVGMFAFAANPGLCARADERFQWFCGDDDLVRATLQKGGRVGVAEGVPILHMGPDTSSANGVDVRPPGWRDHDFALMQEKWGGL